MTHFGILKPYDLRRIWQQDERELNRWLTENLDRLGAAVGITLAAAPQDLPESALAPGVRARDTLRDRTVVIESQLSDSDEGRLGRLIEVAASADACAAIWVAPKVGDAHRAALNWLNRRANGEFGWYALELEAMQIDDSRPALNFNVAVYPHSAVRAERSDSGEGEAAYFARFNSALVDGLREAGTFPQLPVPRGLPELMLHTVHGGVRYGTSFSRNILRAGIWISFPDDATNRSIFERLKEQQREIEAALGGADLTWDFDASRRAQIVTMDHIGVNREDDTQIPALAKWAADGIAKMRGAFEPRLDRIVRDAAKGNGALRAGAGKP